MPTIETLIRENKRKYEGAIEEIFANLDWSEEAKKRMVDEVYTTAREEHARLSEKVQNDAREAMEKARHRAFAPPSIPNADPALVAMSYRAALEKVRETIEPRELTEILERSTLVGDEVLAKAVLIRGYELQHEGLVGEFLRGRPQEEKLWNNFSEKAAEYNEIERMTRLFGTLGPRRPEDIAS